MQEPLSVGKDMRLKEQFLELYFCFKAKPDRRWALSESDLFEDMDMQLPGVLAELPCWYERTSELKGKAQPVGYKLLNWPRRQKDVRGQSAHVLTISSPRAFPEADVEALRTAVNDYACRLAKGYDAEYVLLDTKVVSTWASTRYC